jgi:FKBP-type peptidyl-prolyl cis-trans isomerase (trigger factor)
MIERTEKRMKDQNLTMEQYLTALGKSKEEYRAELKPSAETRLKRGLVLNQIIKEEGLAVSAEEVDQQINLMAESYGEQAEAARKAFSNEEAREAIMIDLLSQAGVKRAMAIAKGEAPALPESQPANEPAASVTELAAPAPEAALPAAEAASSATESAPAESA